MAVDPACRAASRESELVHDTRMDVVPQRLDALVVVPAVRAAVAVGSSAVSHRVEDSLCSGLLEERPGARSSYPHAAGHARAWQNDIRRRRSASALTDERP